jgi:hypothetical protein
LTTSTRRPVQAGMIPTGRRVEVVNTTYRVSS